MLCRLRVQGCKVELICNMLYMPVGSAADGHVCPFACICRHHASHFPAVLNR